MVANQKDLKKFYAGLRLHVFPKNGSWKEASAMRHLSASFVIVMCQLMGIAAVWHAWGLLK